MAKTLSREQFLQSLNDSGLFSQEEISTTLNALPQPTGSDGESVARNLVAAGKLTPYQAEAVSMGRFKGLLIGNYEVLDRLGEGGMGTVYKARHRRMKRVVAIKVLSRTVGQSAQFLQRFQREVEAVARLRHPNIVMAFDADEDDVGHFLVMEFIDGSDLATEVQQRGPLPIPQAVQCIMQAARALDNAHGQGIIHRDIKPANLLRDQSGVVKVADLGLARFSDSAGEPLAEPSALTQAGSIMGTVDFMSPEQALGLTSIDHRADIYSLGCTLYFLLVGKPPYQGQTLMATLLQHRDAPIPSIVEVRRDVPLQLEAIFRRMVAKAPADRMQTMAEVVRALEAIEANSGETATNLAHTITLPHPEVAPAAEVPSRDLDFSLSATNPAPSQTIDLTPPRTSRGISRKVLLVEPSRTQSGIIRKYLQSQGVHDVVAAASGKQALPMILSDRPDVILCAMHLPDMTGVQLAQQVRDENKENAPGFVLITSEAERAEAGTLSKCGRAVLLQKPFTPQQLGDALKLVSDMNQSATRVARSSARPSKLRILIVDDSTSARAHIRHALTSAGLARFVEATDGAQAVAAVAKETFDLIVTDYNMPLMDGCGLVGYLRQNPATASIPIIMATTEKDPTKLDEVRRLGVTVCDKSLPSQVVQQIIEQLV